jgi:hypothetical protein
MLYLADYLNFAKCKLMMNFHLIYVVDELVFPIQNLP